MLKGTVFETAFSVAEWPFLADHRVFGAVVSPGACHLSMALSCAELAHGFRSCRLADMIFPQALIVPESRPRTVQLVLTPRGEAGGAAVASFQLISFRPEDPSERPAIHATGLVEPMAEGTADPVPLADLRARCPHEVAVASLYEASARRGIDLGATFRCLDGVWRGEAEAIGRLVIPPSTVDATGFLLHPGLLDAGFQIAGTAFSGIDEGEALLPFAAKELRLHRPATGTEWWCHVRQLAPRRWDLRFLSPDGEVAAEVVGFEMRSATPADLGGTRTRRDWLYSVAWLPQPDFGLQPGDLPVPQELDRRMQAMGLAGFDRQVLIAVRERGDLGRQAHLAAHGRRVGRLRCPGGRPAPPRRSSDPGHRRGRLHARAPDAFRIRANAPDDWSQLLGAVGEVRGAVHLWGLDGDEVASATDLEAATGRTCGGLLHLVQAILRRRVPPPGLWLVTRGCQVARPCDRATGYAQASLWGLGQVIDLEHPELRCVRVDLDTGTPVEEQAEGLLGELSAELTARPREDRVAFRGGQRLVARLVHQSEAPEGACPGRTASKSRVEGPWTVCACSPWHEGRPAPTRSRSACGPPD